VRLPNAEELEPRTGLKALVVAGADAAENGAETGVVDALFGRAVVVFERVERFDALEAAVWWLAVRLRGADVLLERCFAPVCEQLGGVAALPFPSCCGVRERSTGRQVGVVAAGAAAGVVGAGVVGAGVGVAVVLVVVAVIDVAVVVVGVGVAVVDVGVVDVAVVDVGVGVVVVDVGGVAPAAVAPPIHVVSTVDIASVLARTDTRRLTTARLWPVRRLSFMHDESPRRA
jgi:hypothetical protein